MAVPEYPVLFHKVAGSLIGHNQPIVVPRISSKIDYEGELAIIIGRRGKYIAEEDALSYVAGYTVGNDVSARDLQFRTSQWTTGKMLDTFGPLGPAWSHATKWLIRNHTGDQDDLKWAGDAGWEHGRYDLSCPFYRQLHF